MKSYSGRINVYKITPGAYTAMMGLENYLATTELQPTHKELIKIRASQINGCAYCLDLHTRAARAQGESEQRIYLLSAWRETTLFTEEERAILALTEAVTLIHQEGVPDQVYQDAAALFGDTYLAQLIMAIVAINSWNRVAITSQTLPENAPAPSGTE